jgi:hypothetical protein
MTIPHAVRLIANNRIGEVRLDGVEQQCPAPGQTAALDRQLAEFRLPGSLVQEPTARQAS